MVATEDLRATFERDGLVVVDFDFPAPLLDDVATLIRSHPEFVDAAQPSGYRASARLQDAWRERRGVRELGAHPSVMATLGALYGKQPLPFQTLNFAVGTQQAIHSDAFHFNACPNDGSMCGVWVALEDIDENNGPLVYIPGSHKLPEVYPYSFGLGSARANTDEFYERFALYVSRLALPSRHAIVRKGQAVIWAANLLHGGSPIRDSRRTRFSQVTHYFFGHSHYYWTPLWSDLRFGKKYVRRPEFFDFHGATNSAGLAMQTKRALKRLLPARVVRALRRMRGY